MQLITKASVARYLESDDIRHAIESTRLDGDDALTCQRWLQDSAPKRAAYALLYGDLLRSEGRSVLDVGGGLTSLTREHAQRHRYTLIDLMAHDKPELVRAFTSSMSRLNHLQQDWFAATLDPSYDIIVANDLFPNVDQRLDLFLKAALPRAREVRLSLTYYNSPRFYITKRIDADEVLCMLAWDGAATRACLSRYASRVRDARFELFSESQDSPFANGRQVCIAILNGDRF